MFSLPFSLRLTLTLPPFPLSTQRGGALYISGTYSRFSLDSATQILGNRATDRGNSIYHRSGTINFTSCQPGHYITPEDEGRTHEENITGCVRACPAGTHAAGRPNPPKTQTEAKPSEVEVRGTQNDPGHEEGLWKKQSQ